MLIINPIYKIALAIRYTRDMPDTNSATISTEEYSAHLTKNRIVAVDITRIIAALLVMFGHLALMEYGGGTPVLINAAYGIGIGYVSPVFFVLAGYFACRNITWKKAVYNAVWCFIPYAIWTIITYGVWVLSVYLTGGDLAACYARASSIFGFGQLWMGERAPYPIDGPLWFMRNLIFLFLFAPIIFKYSRLLFPILFFMVFFPELSVYIDRGQAPSPMCNSLYFFSLGCFLRTFPKEWQQAILKFCSPFMVFSYWLLVTALLIMAIFCPEKAGCLSAGNKSTLAITLGLWMLYQTARWLELHVPFVSKVALKLAPVTFLTFAGHWGVYQYLLPLFHLTGKVAVLLPFAIFGVMALLFFAMKRWCRPLLHPVAHYKLRPDDVK